jgi:prepilin-type N-terminal cleavage/methylation domain-containing protein
MPPSSADPRSAERGFTLIEIMCAFGLLAITLSLLSQVQFDAIRKASMAQDMRDVSVAADTVFRKMIYEIDKVQDGASAGLDVAYADYIGLTGVAKDRWAVYRGVVHRRRGLAAGTDPSGKLQPIFGETGDAAPTASSTSSSTSKTPSSTTPASDTAGMQVYQLVYDVYNVTEGGGVDEEGGPVISLTTIVPVPLSEIEETK